MFSRTMKDLSKTETTSPKAHPGRPWGASRIGWAIVCFLAVAALPLHLFLDTPVADWMDPREDYFRHAPWGQAIQQFGKTYAQLWSLLLLAWVSGRRRVLLQGIVALLLVGVCVTGIKLSVQRYRPETRHDSPGKRQERLARGLQGPGRYAFPSGDASSAITVAVVAAPWFPGPWKAVPLLLGAAAGLLRVGTTHHYVSDVIFGFAVGIACALLTLHFYGLWTRPLRRRFGNCTWWRRSGWGFAALLLFPLLEIPIDREAFTLFFNGFGPLAAAMVIASKGGAFLRWVGWNGGGIRRGRFLDTPRLRAHGAGLLITLLVALAALPCLSWTTLYDRDEGYYAECAREMMERSDPFVPTFNGEPWLEKPPLNYWFMMLSMDCFGKTAFGARLPSALAGVLAVWMTFLIGWRLYSPLAGLLGAAALATAFLFLLMGRSATLDTVLLCCFLLSMMGYLDYLQQRTGRRRFWMFYVGCGLGVLAKGPLGLALPILVCVSHLIWARRLHLLRAMQPLRGALVVACIVGAWALPASWLSEGEYFYELVWVRTIQPVFFPLQGHGGGNFWAYLASLPAYVPVLFFGMAPWTLFLWPACRRVWRERCREQSALFLCAWALSLLAIFSLVRTKLPHHILPILPACAIACGAWLADLLGKGRADFGKGVRRGVVAGGIALGLGIFAAPLVFGFSSAWPSFLPAALVVAFGGWWTAKRFERRQGLHGMGMLIATMLFFVAMLVQFGLVEFEGGKAPWQVAHFLRDRHENDLAEIALAHKGFREPSMMFYLRQTAPRISKREEIETFLRQDRPALVILPAEEVAKAVQKGDLRVPFEEIWRRRVWEQGKTEWYDLVIIANGKAMR